VLASANALSLAPAEDGWAVMLTDGRELARFNGADALSGGQPSARRRPS
jgi:hypothetical protein